MIKNGRPYTNENGWEDKGLVTDKEKDVQDAICRWIRENLFPRKTPNMSHSSYGMKHILEDDIGIYLTNNEFKDAMMICGYKPVDENKLNWNYRISEKSPAFRR